MAREQRRLAAIVAADVVGYSRLMGRDESGTVARLREHRKQRFEPVLARHGGRLVKLTGDGALIEFTSAVDALSAAIEFQQTTADANRGQPEDTAIDLYGDAVNVADRLEAQAPPGGIVVSDAVCEAAGGRLKATFADRGSLSLKNIDRPIHAFGVNWDPADRPVPQTPASRVVSSAVRASRKRRILWAANAVSVVSLTIAGYRTFAPQPSATMAELKELKADDLERLLAERRTADAAMAEKKCLAEEARARAERPDPFTERDDDTRRLAMDEHRIRELVADVRNERLPRRRFLHTMVAAGLTMPMAANLLSAAGVAHAQPKTRAEAPTRRGGGGQVRMLYWAAPTLLNPHLAVAPKDFESSQLFYEPLADIDTDGTVVPVLAAETPSVANGGVARDGTSVVWRLKRGLTWHDGRPFTADDVIFTWQYAADPATAATSAGSYQGIDRIDRIDDHTVKVVFKQPTPYWADAFCSAAGMVLPRHVFEPFRGGSSREAAANLRPVGTGPYRFVDFKPGDVLHAEINAAYHVANRPFFDTVEMKGGGDPVSAARAVLQTGEYDYAWGVTMEHEVLRRLEQSAHGHFVIARTANVNYIQLNQTDPWREVDGERASAKTKHPFLTDPAVRSAFALLVDRESIQTHLWGRQADATANFMNRTPYVSPTTRWEFSIDKANAILDAAGWKRGGDGIRAKDGIRLNVLFQSVNQPIRQKMQSVVKQACGRAGIDCELKPVVGSVYFSSDPSNVDTESHFYADLELSAKILRQPDPQAFMRAFCSWEVAQKANKWSGANSTRWRNEEYDRLWRAAETEMDPTKRAAQFIRMNDLVVQNVVVVPVLVQHATFAVANWVRGFDFSPFSGPLWRLAYWSRES